MYRGWPAGCPHCTVSGRRLPWPWEAGWAGRVGTVCVEGEKMKSPSPTQHPSLLLVSSLFSFGYLLFPGDRQPTCSSTPISFSFPRRQEDCTSHLPCSQIQPCDWVPPSRSHLQVWPIKPSPETLLPSLLFWQQLCRVQVERAESVWLYPGSLRQPVEGRALEFHVIHTGLDIRNKPLLC